MAGKISFPHLSAIRLTLFAYIMVGGVTIKCQAVFTFSHQRGTHSNTSRSYSLLIK